MIFINLRQGEEVRRAVSNPAGPVVRPSRRGFAAPQGDECFGISIKYVRVRRSEGPSRTPQHRLCALRDRASPFLRVTNGGGCKNLRQGEEVRRAVSNPAGTVVRPSRQGFALPQGDGCWGMQKTFVRVRRSEGPSRTPQRPMCALRDRASPLLRVTNGGDAKTFVRVRSASARLDPRRDGVCVLRDAALPLLRMTRGVGFH